MRNEAARGPELAPLVFRHDPELPISASRLEIFEALRCHQVLIVAGDTGSGKSTQLPQYCLELGRGRDGLIAHTQPRRLAARALASRISEELSQPVGAAVGFKVRFADQVSASTRLVLMTDGLLLAELASDPDLRRYDTVIVDEAHERSLNVDLLLGVLKRILPRRPELKLIVTSATLAVDRVSQFFCGAPVFRIDGRGHPIEVRYTATDSSVEPEDADLPTAVLEACQDIATTPGAIGDGDVLVFLPGEREIRDVAELLERELSGVEVLTLYSRLSWDQQSRIFKRGPRRRIVLSTNVAETSITVPGIRAVIDSGLARISRYSPRSRLQRLPIEPVSRASADQRKGRCGRIGAGLCLRLFSEEDFEARPEHTEPEILRTNLAALLLRLAADGLGDAETFPFIDPPDTRALNDGYRLLQELQALDEQRRITGRGRAMARLPLDPRLSRALLESRRFNAEAELLAIVSGLSVPDARLPTDRTAGDDAGETAVFEDSKSEFHGLVKLWRAYRQMREGPRRELRRWCKERRLSLLRLSEWEDVHTQVSDRARAAGIAAQRRPASYTGVHRSLLAGFCSMVGVRGEEGDYLGTRGIRFHIFPASPLRRRKPRWVMAANIVETSRIFARTVAEVEPMWIEAAARHLSKREFLAPDWDERRGEVVARERVTFLGLTLSANRIINYGPIAPEESRRIFAREALVHGRLEERPEWLQANDAAIRAAERLEERLRVRDLKHPAEHFVDFYARALPRQVSSAATLSHFTRHLSEVERRALALGPLEIYARRPDEAVLARFPEMVKLGQLDAPAEYRFDPGSSADGVTLTIPVLVLPSLTRAAVDASVPGLAEPRVVAALRSLPKEVRRALIPIGATAASFLSFTGAPSSDLAALSAWLHETRAIPAEQLRFDPTQAPPHLIPKISVVGAEGGEIASGTDLAELRRRTALEARRELDRRAHGAYPEPWRRFEPAELPESLPLELRRGAVVVFPTLKQIGAAIEVRFEWSAREATQSYAEGAVRLARAMLDRQMRDLAKRVSADVRLLLAASAHFGRDEVIDLLLQLSCRSACFADLDPPRTRAAFESAVDRGRADLHEALERATAELGAWLAEARNLRRLLEDPRARSHAAAAGETQAHVRELLRPERLNSMSSDWLRQLARYLKAEERRWQRLFARGGESPNILPELESWSSRAASLDKRAAAELRRPPELEELRLWIEEYRVSLYAQELKTRGPVSAARLGEREAQLLAWFAR